jgi:hypothetical protein
MNTLGDGILADIDRISTLVADNPTSPWSLKETAFSRLVSPEVLPVMEKALNTVKDLTARLDTLKRLTIRAGILYYLRQESNGTPGSEESISIAAVANFDMSLNDDFPFDALAIACVYPKLVQRRDKERLLMCWRYTEETSLMKSLKHHKLVEGLLSLGADPSEPAIPSRSTAPVLYYAMSRRHIKTALVLMGDLRTRLPWNEPAYLWARVEGENYGDEPTILYWNFHNHLTVILLLVHSNRINKARLSSDCIRYLSEFILKNE